MGLSPILSNIHTVTIVGTMLNFNGGNNRQGLKTLRVNRPLVFSQTILYSLQYHPYNRLKIYPQSMYYYFRLIHLMGKAQFEKSRIACYTYVKTEQHSTLYTHVHKNQCLIQMRSCQFRLKFY